MTEDALIKRGGDDAYVEFNVEDMGILLDYIRKNKSNVPIKHLLLKCGRIELSDTKQIECFKNVLYDILNSEEGKSLNDAQFGFLAFRKIFEKGLEFWDNE